MLYMFPCEKTDKVVKSPAFRCHVGCLLFFVVQLVGTFTTNIYFDMCDASLLYVDSKSHDIFTTIPTLWQPASQSGPSPKTKTNNGEKNVSFIENLLHIIAHLNPPWWCPSLSSSLLPYFDLIWFSHQPNASRMVSLYCLNSVRIFICARYEHVIIYIMTHVNIPMEAVAYRLACCRAHLLKSLAWIFGC